MLPEGGPTAPQHVRPTAADTSQLHLPASFFLSARKGGAWGDRINELICKGEVAEWWPSSGFDTAQVTSFSLQAEQALEVGMEYLPEVPPRSDVSSQTVTSKLCASVTYPRLAAGGPRYHWLLGGERTRRLATYRLSGCQ